MPITANGQLVPVGGGDNIPLIRHVLTLGRRETCDVCLRFPNVSGRHCELTFVEGYWYVRDLNSTNGIKVNGVRVREKMLLHPGAELSIARRRFTIEYELPTDRRALEEQAPEDMMSQSLLEKAGLVRPKRHRRKGGDTADADTFGYEDENGR
jgi:adenylate cyclase